jgi:sulfur-oxidizing protein SoxA
VDLNTRINLCCERHQAQPRWPSEHTELLALESFIGMQSRGLPIAPASDMRREPYRAPG